jgi:hypothetical protein
MQMRSRSDMPVKERVRRCECVGDQPCTIRDEVGGRCSNSRKKEYMWRGGRSWGVRARVLRGRRSRSKASKRRGRGFGMRESGNCSGNLRESTRMRVYVWSGGRGKGRYRRVGFRDRVRARV